VRRPDSQVERSASKSVGIAAQQAPIQRLKAPSAPAIPNRTAPIRQAPINRPTTPVTPTSATGKVPKKGSFAEIMARAKKAQETLQQVGKIQHKPIDKAPSKRERQDAKDQQQNGRRPSSTKSKSDLKRDGRDRPTQSGKGSRPAPPEPERKIKKAATATTGYTGTARPNPALARSLATRQSSTPRYGSASRDTYRSDSEPRRYKLVESEEDEEDYESDVSSDMEAAVFEVDEEEERAARLARQEDADALREENRLKAEKEAKRRRLAAMAKTRR
jgi:protein SPT2